MNYHGKWSQNISNCRRSLDLFGLLHKIESFYCWYLVDSMNKKLRRDGVSFIKRIHCEDMLKVQNIIPRYVNYFSKRCLIQNTTGFLFISKSRIFGIEKMMLEIILIT